MDGLLMGIVMISTTI
jgi:hypothetical protein